MKNLTYLLPIIIAALFFGGFSQTTYACSFTAGSSSDGTTITGTAGDDSVFCFDSGESIVDVLAGNDDVTIEGLGGTADSDADYINLGDGDDTITVATNNDMTVTPAGAPFAGIETGTGVNTVIINGSTISIIEISDGTDTITLNDSTVVTIQDAGATTDSIITANNSFISNAIITSPGTTVIILNDTVLSPGSLGISTSGVTDVTLNGTSSFDAAAVIQSAGSDDTFTFNVPKANFDATTQLTCGAGTDTVNIYVEEGAIGYDITTDGALIQANGCENVNFVHTCTYTPGGTSGPTTGNDTITCDAGDTDLSSTATIQGLDGDDTFTISDVTVERIDGDTGDDVVTITDSIVNAVSMNSGTLELNLLGSNDIFTVTAALVDINMRGSSSITRIDDVLGGTLTMSDGTSAGSLVMPFGSVVVNMSGNSVVDTIDLGLFSIDSQTVLLEGNAQISTSITFYGGGDTITVNVPKANFDATTQLTCGAGTDTVIIDETAGATGYGSSLTAADFVSGDCENIIYTQVPEASVSSGGSSSGSRRRTPDQVEVAFGYDTSVGTTGTSSTTATASSIGCTNSSALNYNASASQDNGSCMYAEEQIPDDFYIANSCSRVFNQYVSQGDQNDEVTLWQKFLNFGFNESIDETGYFGEQTFGGVKRFQEFFTGAILSPWGLTEGTGGVYQTTRSWANRITGCPEQGFIVEGKTVNHATFAIPRGYDFLKTFNTANQAGSASVNVQETIDIITVNTNTNTATPFVAETPVTPTQAVDQNSSAGVTGDAEIDVLLQAIYDIEGRIDSLN